MIQTSFPVLFLSSDIYGRPKLIKVTIFTMTVPAGFIRHRFIRNWLLHVLAKDGVSVGCLFLFSACLNVLFAFVYDIHRKVLSSCLSALLSDTAVLGNDKCLI